MQRIFVFLACIALLSCNGETEPQKVHISIEDTLAKTKPEVKRQPVIDSVYTTEDIRIYADISIDTSKIRNIRVRFKPYISFSDFGAVIDNSKKAKLDLYSHQYGRTYRTSLSNDFANDSANFAGHYTLVTNGCGSPCQISLLIDRHTGKIYDVPPSSTGVDYRPDSRMLIVNPPEEDGYYYADCFYCIPEIYIFNEKTKVFEERQPNAF